MKNVLQATLTVDPFSRKFIQLIEACVQYPSICISYVAFGDDMSNRKLVSFRLPDDLMHNLRQEADHNGISVTELVCRLLWHGLQTRSDKQEAVDERIASLEAEIQELRQARPALTSLPPTPLYALLTQGSIAQDGNVEMRARLSRLEQLMETLITQNIAPHASTSHNPVAPVPYSQDADASVSKAIAPHRPDE
jgi:hypothetical protein